MAIESVNPSTGTLLERFEPLSGTELEARLERAALAFPDWRRRGFAERARCLQGLAGLLEAEEERLARLATTEMGKPIAQARAEVRKCASACRYFAEHGEELARGEPGPAGRARRRCGTVLEPLGPVLAVMPWNFPFWQVVRFAAPALALGNVALLKHASNVPQVALAIEDLTVRAGMPQGVFQTLLVDAGEVARLVADPRVRGVSLTGSEAAGRAVAAAAGAALKKSVLELGGSDPFIVMPSADLDRAAEVGVRARVQNNGQSCIAAKRFLVHEAVADAFEERFVERMASLEVGDPAEESVDVGPLATARGRSDLSAQVDDARDKGAHVLLGGAAPERPGFFYSPTVLTGVEPGMRAYEEEVFGPVASLFRVRSAEEAVRLANDTSFGLGAAVFTEDDEEQRYFVESLEAGLVFVNSMVASTPELPFGGVKASGYGRELGAAGLREFANLKTVWVD
jgi:succinate-semialdehyde dehydrogenase/glutarate-semialdehyde dehydrogenase